MSTRLVELIAAGIFLVCILDGVHKGLLLKVFSLLRMVVVLVLTMILVPVLKPLFAANSEVQSGAAYVIALLVAVIAVGIVVRVLKLVDHIPVLKTVNRLGGAVFGACIGIVLIWVLLAVIGSVSGCSVVQGNFECVRQSEILRTIQKFDPMSYVLKKLIFRCCFDG